MKNIREKKTQKLETRKKEEKKVNYNLSKTKEEEIKQKSSS